MPASPPNTITPTCIAICGHSSSAAAAPTAIARCAASPQKSRVMPHTAWITTTTATSFMPCSASGGSSAPQRIRPSAKPIMISADGRVNPHHAAKAPRTPAWDRPSAIPT